MGQKFGPETLLNCECQALFKIFLINFLNWVDWPLAVPVFVLNISHPLLNNTRCAQPYVTSAYNPNNVYVPSNVVLSYNSNPDDRGNWAIERGDGLQIPAGAAFHVYIDPQQSRRCNTELLSDGFE